MDQTELTSLLISSRLPLMPPTGWEGEFCERDEDGCTDLACFPGVECVDNVAPNTGATCGACPLGLSGSGIQCFGI